MSQLDPQERARLYLRKMDPAIAGQRGHDSLFNAACAMVRNFDLAEEATFRLLAEEYNPSCDPPFNERELRHKVRDAYRKVGERGVLLDAKEDRSDYRRWFSKPAAPALAKPATPSTTKETIHYPPKEEVDALWASSSAACDDEGVSTWLASRGISAALVADHNLCRALPLGVALPSWAGNKRGSWSMLGYRALFPLFDASGSMVSLRVRSISGAPLKVLTPTGYTVRGAVLADPLGCLLLVAGDVSWWSPERRVIIAEGEPDWLSWSTKYSDADESAPAVFGVFAGSWSQEIADRIPAGCMVSVDTDNDEAGQKYADSICPTLVGQCRVFRNKRNQ